LQEPGSYVGEVVKVMAKTKVLVKVRREPPTRPTPGRARPRPPLAAPRPSFPFANRTNRARDRSPRPEIRPSFRRVVVVVPPVRPSSR